MKLFYSFLTFFFSGILVAQSPLLLENFNYTAGQALSDNTWNIHSTGGATPNPILVSAAGLDFANYQASGIGNAALVTNTGQDVNKQLSANVNSGAVYASFLMTVTENTPEGFFFHFAYYNNQTTPDFTSINSAFRARTYVSPGDNTATQFKLGLAFNATTTQGLTGNLNIGQTYLVVVKYLFIDGPTNDEVSLFVFASGDNFGTEPSTPTLGPFTNTSSGTPPAPTADAPVLQAVALRQYSATQRITVDGIIVRTAWDISLSADSFTKDETLTLYPNPVSSGVVNINVQGDKNIQLFDISGRQVLNTNTSENSFNVDGLNAGVYVVKVTSENTALTSKLIIK